MTMRLPTLILAAGASSRMRGGDKLLEEVQGVPCLRVLALRALTTGQPVFVTLPDPAHPRLQCLQGLDITPVMVPDADQGMSRSLQRGVAALPDTAKGVMILPGDMPEIRAEDMRDMQQLFCASKALALRATTQDGRKGHPIVFDASLFKEFQHLEGDKGAQPVLETLGDKLQFHPLSGARARLDLDTPEDWANWRASKERLQSRRGASRGEKPRF